VRARAATTTPLDQEPRKESLSPNRLGAHHFVSTPCPPSSGAGGCLIQPGSAAQWDHHLVLKVHEV